MMNHCRKTIAVLLSAALLGAALTACAPAGTTGQTPGTEEPGTTPETPGTTPENPGTGDVFDTGTTPEGILGLSHESGVYASDLLLSVSAGEASHTIYYTLDGSLPTEDSLCYSAPIVIRDEGASRDYPLTDAVAAWYDSLYAPRGTYEYETGNACTVVRLLEVDAQGNEVARKTKTYFIREKGAAAFELPVISLSLPQENAVAFYTDIEEEPKERAEMEYFDFASGERFALNTQIKVGGNWTKWFPYHTMNVNFNKDENDKKNEPVTVKAFGDRPARDGSELTDFKRFRLHCGGNSQNITWFGDAFVQRVAAEIAPESGDMVQTATTGYRPCEVYINGEYWGMYAIREHYADVYFEQNYGVDKDDVILIDRSHYVVEGDSAYEDDAVFNTRYHFEVAEDDEEERGMAYATELFDALYAAVGLAEAGDMDGYARAIADLGDMIDVQSLTDLILVQFYTGNWDFMSNNIKMWRTANVDPENPYADGKWRFCLHDLDFSFEFAWGDNGLSGANGYLLYDQSDYSYSVDSFDPAYMESAPYTYRPGVNYLDFYLGNAYLNYNGVGTLSLENTCLFSAFVYDEGFRETFAARAQEIAEIYTSDAALEILDEMEEEVDTPIQRHVLRWNRTQWNDSFDYSIWKDKLSNTRAVLASRTNCYGIYPNNDYLDRQIEAAFWRYLNDISYDA